MQVFVRLPEDVVSTLSSYGDLSDVITKILDNWEYGDTLTCEMPREHDKRYRLNIHSQAYETTRYMYGATSNRCSIRGILCKVVYYMLDWLDAIMKCENGDNYIALLESIYESINVALKLKNNDNLIKAREYIDGAIQSCKNKIQN